MTAELILRLARESEATDSEPRPEPIELLNRAMEWSPAAEEAASAVLVNAGCTLAHPSAPVVCSAIEYGIRQGPGAKVRNYVPWTGRSNRTLARRLSDFDLPTISELVRLGICIRAADALAQAGPKRGRCKAATRIAGFKSQFELSNYLLRAMGARPSTLREDRPVAIAARVLARGSAHAD